MRANGSHKCCVCYQPVTDIYGANTSAAAPRVCSLPAFQHQRPTMERGQVSYRNSYLEFFVKIKTDFVKKKRKIPDDDSVEVIVLAFAFRDMFTCRVDLSFQLEEHLGPLMNAPFMVTL